MRRARSSQKTRPPAEEPAVRVSLRALYAAAMRQVMADPRRAIAEHDPPLATLLPFTPKPPGS